MPSSKPPSKAVHRNKHAPSNAPDRLTALPAELRNRLYTLILHSPSPIKLHAKPTKQPGMLLASRQIRHEALPLYYAENFFAVAVPMGRLPAVARWVQSLARALGKRPVGGLRIRIGHCAWTELRAVVPLVRVLWKTGVEFGGRPEGGGGDLWGESELVRTNTYPGSPMWQAVQEGFEIGCGGGRGLLTREGLDAALDGWLARWEHKAVLARGRSAAKVRRQEEELLREEALEEKARGEKVREEKVREEKAQKDEARKRIVALSSGFTCERVRGWWGL